MAAVMGSNWSALPSVAAAAFIGLVFAHAAWHKLSDFGAFMGFVADYQVTPEPAVECVSRAVASAEVAVPLALIFNGTRHSGALLAMVMLLGYAAAIGLNLLRSRRQVSCGCGGAEQLLDWSLVVRNVVLTGIAGLVLVANQPSLSSGEAAAAVAAGLTLWSAFGVVEQVLANASRIRGLSSEML
jgi:hypothetical protein